jgi:hypothetical protein
MEVIYPLVGLENGVGKTNQELLQTHAIAMTWEYGFGTIRNI